MSSSQAMKKIECPSCRAESCKRIGPAPTSPTFNGQATEATKRMLSVLYRCTTCALHFKNPRISNTDAISLYDNGNTLQYYIPNRNDHREILTQISELKPKSILDFGCYTGDLLSKIENSTSKYGIEVNTAAADLAVKKSGASIMAGIHELRSKVECIILCDVIEHLDDPAATIMELNEYLNVDGYIILTTGNCKHWYSSISGSSWYYSSNAEHISFISPSWLEWFCKKNEAFSLHRIRSFRYEQKLPLKILYDILKSLIYSTSPSIYRKVQDRKNGDHGIPGLSAWRDHMIVVLKKNGEK